jgi:hypothetical protein
LKIVTFIYLILREEGNFSEPFPESEGVRRALSG